jgi:hypothetical protein
VIEMRMRKNNRINFTRRNRSVLPVALAPFFLSLKKSAVDQNLESLLAARIISGVDQVLRASHGPGSAEKLDVGQTFSSKRRRILLLAISFWLLASAKGQQLKAKSSSYGAEILNTLFVSRFPERCRR